MFTQLNPPIPLHAVGRGNGLAYGVIDMGPDHDLLWVLILDDSGEVWTLSNRVVRGVANVTMGRPAPVAVAPGLA